ncbi:hypothetical protein [uncultured Bacteroides sp.]|uniref:hypothetical protein n=1 Tax=uncultured Bacteroides sp. TaxID=162156 RepID=UPI0025D33425|nr:hypothetical protein [uncultured Bacteroides sp.]
MSTNDLATRYRLLNSSFKKTMVYHIGIDAGFFTEYTYMIHAMLYCLQHKIQFKLYSDDANFGWEKGWEDCFIPFCEEVHEPFHHTYNTHRLPSWKTLMQDKKQPKTRLLKWKLKATYKNVTGKILAFLIYNKPVSLNFQIKFNPNQHFHIPELEIDGDYLHAFRKLTEITWKLNAATAQECRQLADNLQLPPQYVGCQIRGGDKITETNLLPPEHYIQLIKKKTAIRDIFVLTDDYRLFQQVQTLAPDMRWYTLCSPDEKGYVNSSFTRSDKELKQKQMARFLSSIQILMGASVFTGSITTGPSLFLLKKFYPDISPADCSHEDFPHASTLPIPERGRVAAEYIRRH